MGEPKHKSLRSIRLLADLDAGERADIERKCSWQDVEEGQQIIDHESSTNDVYFVVEGTVRVINYSLSGREITFDDLRAGSYFGELSAIDGEPRSANVMALTDTRVAALPAEKFIKMIRDHPAVSHKLIMRLVDIVRTSTDRIMDLSTLGAHNRVHAELLRQAKRLNSDPNQAVINPIPNHRVIASRVSTTRETVARVMTELARQDLVERRQNELHILDLRRFEEMVETVRGRALPHDVTD